MRYWREVEGFVRIFYRTIIVAAVILVGVPACIILYIAHKAGVIPKLTCLQFAESATTQNTAYGVSDV